MENKDDMVHEELDNSLEKLDENYYKRKLEGRNRILVVVLGLCMSLFHLYTAGFGLFEAILQRSIHLSFALALAFLLYPLKRGTAGSKIPFYDYILAFLGAYAPSYVVINYNTLVMRAGYLTTMDIVMGVVLIVLVFEAARRVVGVALPSISLLFFLYAYFGKYIPGTYGHRGFPMVSIIRHMFLTTEGIFGVALGVTATFIFLFILFGAILNVTGTGQVFIDLALGMFGKSKGGPGKAAVVASSLFGTINGSSVANIMGTGIFTIPLMKKAGFKDHFAGAVEATASCGGQIMPPIMGAGAFIMAEFLGISYLKVALAAAVPAVLYYLGVFSTVHFEASKLEIEGIENVPSVKDTFIKTGYLLIPLVVLIYYLLGGYTPTKAAFISILVSIAINMLSKNRMNLKKIIDVLSQGAEDALQLVIACSVIGIIIGTVSLTGLGVKVANSIISLAGTHLIFALLLTHFVCILLGMGLPTTAKYIMVAMMAIPALIELGVVPIAAHFFVFYYAILSDLTPPVALGAMAAAGVAKSDFYKTAFSSIKLALAGFIIPYFFALSPQLILGAVPFSLEVVIAILSAMVSIYFISAGLSNWLFCSMTKLQRILIVSGSLLMIAPMYTADLVGLALVGFVVVSNYRLGKVKSSVKAA